MTDCPCESSSALGDTATQDGDLVGDVLALVARIETIAPPDEIYLTTAACLALTQSEIRTGIVDSFSLKGFSEPIQVYRVEQRHRTHIFTNSLDSLQRSAGVRTARSSRVRKQH